jgi:U3 small nucleolar RNA-associated protein 12
VTCGTGKELKFWHLHSEGEEGKRLVEKGTLEKQSADRGISLVFDESGTFLAIGNADKSVEVIRRRSPDQVKKSVLKKQKRRKEKGLEPDPTISDESIAEIFVPFTLLRLPAKVRCVDWRSQRKSKDKIELLVLLANNSLETYSINVPESFKTSGPADYSRTYTLDLLGHRSDIRSLSLSSDSKLVASASNGALKVWNARSGSCLRTMECGYALCSSFLPGDSLVVVGTKAGEIELFDVGSSSLMETVDAHKGALWSLDVSTDGKVMVTGGADKTVKFWEFRVVQEEVLGTTRTTPRMKLKHTKTLELSDDVLAVRISRDGKYAAASLLDNTIKVFFVDSLKFFLNLYGHKLPVLSLDISDDSKLLVSCSADKNIKIWGLDFGDCHKSIFAHQDSIMKVVFEPSSHNFFSVSKDRLLKYWDGDKFEQIQGLAGHHSEIWALGIANDASIVVTGSHDRSIRVWAQSEEPLFIQEERENELEELYESNLLESLEDENDLTKDAGDEHESQVTRAGKQTIETLKAGERLMEALDIGVKDLDDLQQHTRELQKNPTLAPPQRNVILAALNVPAERYVIDILRKIPASQLEDALLVFPFDKVISLFRFIEIWTAHKWYISLVCRVLFFTMKTYHKQIVANKVMRTLLIKLRDNLRRALYQERGQIGYNMAGLKFLKQSWDDQHHKDFLADDEVQEKNHQQLKKRVFATIQ